MYYLASLFHNKFSKMQRAFVLTLCKAGRMSEHATNSQAHRLRSIAEIKDTDLLVRNCKWTSYTANKLYKYNIHYYIVAYSPVAKRRLSKQPLFLCNGSINTFPRQ
jgi:hypothetical protein